MGNPLLRKAISRMISCIEIGFSYADFYFENALAKLSQSLLRFPDSFCTFQGAIRMKCTKKERYFVRYRFNEFGETYLCVFSSIFSIQVLYQNKIPKILGIFLKINGLMENPDPGTDVNKTTFPNGIMTLRS